MVNVGRIRQLANQRGIKMKYLCAKLNVNPGYFANVAQKRFQMPTDKIYAVADLLQTSFEYLTDQTDDPSLGKESYVNNINELNMARMAERKRSVPVPRFDYDRFNERRIARGLTPDYCESQFNLPDGFWEDVRDGYREADRQTIERLALLLETTYDYLMGLTDDPSVPLDDKTGIKIGVFGDVAAGIPIDRIENFDPEDPDSWEEIDRSMAKGGTYFALRIKGDSMAPRILAGDVVIVRYQPTAESGQIAVVAVNGDMATCKKVFWSENGDLSLISLNPNYPPYHYTAEQVREKPVTILGVVVELRGKF